MNTVIASRIYNLVSNDPVKVAILDLLADGNWHTRFEVESIAKDLRPTIGLVGICTIIRTLKDADSQLVEMYDNDSGVFYRLNPQRTTLIKKIVVHLRKNTKDRSTSSSSHFKRFKETIKTTRQKSEKLDDDDLKQFL